MMSLLVTLIMKQYDRVSKDAVLCNYQQKAKLIFENSYLTQLCRCCRRSNFELERNLMIITDLTNHGITLSGISASQDPIEVMQENIKMLVKDNWELRQLVQKQGQHTADQIDSIVNHLKIKVG